MRSIWGCLVVTYIPVTVEATSVKSERANHVYLARRQPFL
jgi:hypothetical protein